MAEQTLSAAETVVIDDGSRDGTAQLVREQFAWARVLEVPNGGPSRARNHGIQAAQGDWVAFLDADDRWHPDKLRRQWAVVEREPGLAVVASDWVRRWEAPPRLPETPATSVLGYRDLLILNRFQTSTVLARRRFLAELGGFDPGVDGAEDWDLWLRLAERGTVKKLDEPLVMYRDVSTGYSKDVFRVFQTMRPMLEKHRSRFPPHTFRTIEAWHYLRFWVGLSRIGDRKRAAEVLGALFAAGLWPYAPGAAVRYLLPFLWRRRLRRTG